MKDKDAVAEYIRQLASRGGKVRSKKLSSKRRKEIARQGARARWGEKKGKRL